MTRYSFSQIFPWNLQSPFLLLCTYRIVVLPRSPTLQYLDQNGKRALHFHFALKFSGSKGFSLTNDRIQGENGKRNTIQISQGLLFFCYIEFSLKLSFFFYSILQRNKLIYMGKKNLSFFRATTVYNAEKLNTKPYCFSPHNMPVHTDRSLSLFLKINPSVILLN